MNSSRYKIWILFLVACLGGWLGLVWLDNGTESLESAALASAFCARGWALTDQIPPEHLSDTGVFMDLKTMAPCPGVAPYSVNTPLWSDGAEKKRWVILPPDQKVQFSEEDPWKFPKGTVFIKHFELNSPEGHGVRVETRISAITQSGQWSGYTYSWNEDQSDATLLSSSLEREVNLGRNSPSGSMQKQKWIYPSRSMCLQCHNAWSGAALGLRTEQLNQSMAAGGAFQNQLEAWDAQGFFSKPIPKAATLKRYAHLNDSSESIDTRVRSYLAVNCAHCHQPGTAIRSPVDLRFKTPLPYTQMINEMANLGDMGLEEPLIIKPGDHSLSVLWIRMNTTNTHHMPLIGAAITDQEAVDLVRDWIDQMKPN